MWRLEPWSPDWNPPEREALDSHPLDGVRIDLEGSWNPIRPAIVPPEEWPPMFFVDGRQRVEGRLSDPQGRIGLLASFAVGALQRDGKGLRLWDTPRVYRVFLHNGAENSPLGNYTPIRLEADERELPLVLVRLLRKYEAALINELPEGLVIADGQLTQKHRVGVLGYTKTQAAAYLPPEATPLLSTLQVGERTPIFTIKGRNSGRPLDLFSWYVRLPLPGNYAPTAALMRVETPAGEDLPVHLADLSTSLFCTTAAVPGRDPRAPQSLVPIAGLEQIISRYLGNPAVVQRRILASLSRQTSQ